MLDPVGLEELAQGAVVSVDEGVVGEQPPRLDPELGEVRQRALDEGCDRLGTLVRVKLAVGVAAVVVDDRVHPLMTDAHPPLTAAAIAVAGDGVPCSAEADEALAVDVQQVAGTRPLVQPRLLARLRRRSRDPRSASASSRRSRADDRSRRRFTVVPSRSGAWPRRSEPARPARAAAANDAAATIDPRDTTATRAARARPLASAATTCRRSSPRRRGLSPQHDTTTPPRRQRRARDDQRVRDERYGEAPSGSLLRA